MFLYKLPFGALQTNAILFGCDKTKNGVIIDPSPGSAQSLLNIVKKESIVVEKILLTHSHWDHFADAHVLKEEIKAPLYVHPLDAKNLTDPGSDRLPLLIEIHSVQPDRFLQDGDLLKVGTIEMMVIHTPGHCPGSVCFYVPQHKILFSGDTLFRSAMGSLSLPTAQPSKMWSSLARLAKLPPDTRVIPGHGPDTSIGEESWLSDYQ